MGDLEKEKIKSKSAEVKKEAKTDFKQKLGNILLLITILLIITTGSFTYYLIHSAKADFEDTIDTSIENIDKEPETIANIIDSALEETPIQVGIDSNQIANEKQIVLYKGFVLDTSKMNEVNLQYIKQNEEEKDKYVITYKNYENFGYKNSTLGILSEPLYENSLKIENVGKIAISEDYEAISREIKVVNTIPNAILEKDSKLLEYDAVKTIVADLDGNNSNEYILVLANKKTGFSKIMLLNSKGVKVSDLAFLEKSKWSNPTTEYYLSINNIEILDVDNDGIMEILIEIPHYEGNPTVSLLKFKDGGLQGKSGISCSLLP